MVKILKERIRGNISTSVIVLYFFLSFLSLFESQLLLINAAIVLLGVYLFLSNFNYIKSKHLPLLLITFLFAGYSIVCLFLFQGKITYTPIRVIIHFSFFMAIVRYGMKANVIKWLLYIYVGYILYLLFVQGVYINSIFPGTSKNIIGWFALGLCVFYYLLALNKDNNIGKVEFGPVMVTMLICLISLGRSNIMCSFLLLGVILWYNFQHYSLLKKLSFLFSIFFVSSLILYLSYDFLTNSLQRFDQRGFESSERSLFIDGYFEKLNLSTFLFGVNSDQYPFTLINGNFHNSFLLGHSNFGLLFVGFLLYIAQLLIKNVYSSFLLVILVLTLLLRSYTDTIMFIGYFDFILFVLLYKIAKG